MRPWPVLVISVVVLLGLTLGWMAFPSRSTPKPLPPAQVRLAPVLPLPRSDIAADPLPSDGEKLFHSRHTRQRRAEGTLLRRLRHMIDVQSGYGQSDLFTDVMTQLARLDPGAAARFVEKLLPGGQREEALRIVARIWSGIDHNNAESWAAGLPDVSERKTALVDVCSRLAEDDPAAAVQTLCQHGLDVAPTSPLPDLVQQWARKDFDAAQAWINARSDSESRDVLSARLVTELASSAPVAAARMVVHDLPSGPLQEETAMTVVHQWGMMDLMGATNWVEHFPPGPLRERGLNELAGVAASR